MNQKTRKENQDFLFQLKIEVKKFREACDLLAEDIRNGKVKEDFGPWIVMGMFPESACFYISELLAIYLIKKFPEINVFLVHAKFSRKSDCWGEHMWVETHSGIALDITYDQFNKDSEKVIAEKNPSAHKEMEKREKTKCKPECSDGNMQKLLYAIENYIIER